jgi:hypothetical protein
MLPRRRFLLILLAMIATFACLILKQLATRARLQKQLSELQERHAAQMLRQEEHRQRLEKIRHEPARFLPRERPPQGDHWLPGELDRLRIGPLPAGEA